MFDGAWKDLTNTQLAVDAVPKTIIRRARDAVSNGSIIQTRPWLTLDMAPIGTVHSSI